MGGLEKGQRRTMADERRIKDKDDRMRRETPVQFRMHENGHVSYLSVMRKYLCYITCCWFKKVQNRNMNLYITNSLPFVRFRKTRGEA